MTPVARFPKPGICNLQPAERGRRIAYTLGKRSVERVAMDQEGQGAQAHACQGGNGGRSDGVVAGRMQCSDQ